MENSVIFQADAPTNAVNMANEKETTNTMVLVGFNKGEFSEPVTVRWYMARRSDGASPVYCSVWVHYDGEYRSGRGKASGYGYHKASAALQAALDSAGITLEHPIDGRGDSASRGALEAIARWLEIPHFHIVEA